MRSGPARAQLQNKQDWARLWGYEVHQMAELVDGHMRPGPWQKVGLLRKVRALRLIWHRCRPQSSAAAALALPRRLQTVQTHWHHALCTMYIARRSPNRVSRLRVPKQALNSVPRSRAEWVLWLDMDMVLEDVTFALPLASYAGKDLVMWGQPEWIMKGHNAKGEARRSPFSAFHSLLRREQDLLSSCVPDEGALATSSGRRWTSPMLRSSVMHRLLGTNMLTGAQHHSSTLGGCSAHSQYPLDVGSTAFAVLHAQNMAPAGPLRQQQHPAAFLAGLNTGSALIRNMN